MAKKIVVDVLYADGHEESIPVRPISLVAAEREFAGKDAASIEMTLWAAWHGIQGEKPTFTAWLATLDAIEEKKVEQAPLVPSGASTPSSSISPPAPE